SCTESPASFLANAGTGSACGQKPVLGTPVSFDENVPDGGECFAVWPADGEGNLLQSNFEPAGSVPFQLQVAHAHHADGTPFAQATFGQFDGQFFYPLSSGWLVEDFASQFQPPILLLTYSADLQAQSERTDPTRTFDYPSTAVRAPGGGAVGVGVAET